MGKVMPRYDLAPRPQSRHETAEGAQHVTHVTPTAATAVVESEKVAAPRVLGGVASQKWRWVKSSYVVKLLRFNLSQ